MIIHQICQVCPTKVSLRMVVVSVLSYIFISLFLYMSLQAILGSTVNNLYLFEGTVAMYHYPLYYYRSNNANSAAICSINVYKNIVSPSSVQIKSYLCMQFCKLNSLITTNCQQFKICNSNMLILLFVSAAIEGYCTADQQKHNNYYYNYYNCNNNSLIIIITSSGWR